MKKLLSKIRLFFKPELVQTICLPTGVVCEHYKGWDGTITIKTVE
tara:strand:- start:741 stop:875 length:135 start_codon:yes stop_codon:yes gene_type:complete